MKALKVTQFRPTKGHQGPDPGEWFQMAHKLMRALYSTKELDKTQVKLMLYSVHNTWGQMGRKSFIFTTAAAAKELGLDKAQVRRAKDTLIEANMLIKVDKDGNEIKVNKYPESWDLSILQGKRALETQRRKSYGEGGEDTSPLPSEADTSPLGGGYVPPEGEDTSPLIGQKPAQEADPGEPIDKYIDNTDIPPIVPQGTEVKETSMTSKYDPLYRFDDWYNHFPKKKGRGVAERAWGKLTKLKEFDDAFVDRLIEALNKQKQVDRDWKRGFICNPATWLNGKEWLNEYNADLPMAANGGPAKRQSVDDVLDAWMRGDGG